MTSNTTSSSPTASSSHPSHIDQNGQPWDTSKNHHLLWLSHNNLFSIEAIQAAHYPTFTVAQLTDIIARAQAERDAKQKGTGLAEKVAEQTKDLNSEDEVIDSGFAKRRGGQPAWEGTTTKWESRGKPGIGWTPVSERPDMKTFLKGFKAPGEEKGEDDEGGKSG
jgi:hypothetical protein